MAKQTDPLYIKKHDRTIESVPIERVMTARKRNHNKERLMGFLNNDDNWVNATLIVGLDGEPVNISLLSLQLDVIAEQLIEINQGIKELNNAV